MKTSNGFIILCGNESSVSLQALDTVAALFDATTTGGLLRHAGKVLLTS